MASLVMENSVFRVSVGDAHIGTVNFKYTLTLLYRECQWLKITFIMRAVFMNAFSPHKRASMVDLSKIKSN
jgi:hypothetical protein